MALRNSDKPMLMNLNEDE
jgi:pSer/pThr/pTyr-binding forkhead associated (FHA) protein